MKLHKGALVNGAIQPFYEFAIRVYEPGGVNFLALQSTYLAKCFSMEYLSVIKGGTKRIGFAENGHLVQGS